MNIAFISDRRKMRLSPSGEIAMYRSKSCERNGTRNRVPRCSDHAASPRTGRSTGAK